MIKFKKEHKHLTKPELQAKIRELDTKIIRTRLELSLKKIKNLRSVFNMRKELAVLKTYENDKR